MLIDDKRTRELLARIVVRLSNDPAVRDDLMQEAIVHLWLLEARRPGQTLSWYLQSCKYHLQNYLNMGRSVDSPKRKAGKVTLDTHEEAFDQFLTGHNEEEEFFAHLSARDILHQLSTRLTGFELEVLAHLAEGLGAREIAERLRVTHPTVIKYRRRIAAQVQRLGIEPVMAYPRQPALAAAR
jgi:RNA polymerase sigma factor (sigma-70 family)